MKRTAMRHEFVESTPPELEEGVLYVSVQYATAVHNCACGCGNKVITPLSPVDWQLLFDGYTVSLTPSIGNWQFPCRSHYWIKADEVCWAGPWTDEEIAAGRQREARDRDRHFESRRVANTAAAQTDTEAQRSRRRWRGRLAGLLRWIRP